MRAEDRVAEMLARCGSAAAVMPPTQLYNEGWMLRLALDWYARQPMSEAPLAFSLGARWYSEALLPSVFFATKRGDSRAEGWTNADGVVGHFQLRPGGRGDIELISGASQLVIVEAKLRSGLSAGVKNAPAYNQAARNVACLCHLVERSGREVTADWRLGFYVLAPQSRIDEGIFGSLLSLEGPAGIKAVVAERVKTFAPALDQWHEKHFLRILTRVRIHEISWESILENIRHVDPEAASELALFYQQCLQHNRLTTGAGADATS